MKVDFSAVLRSLEGKPIVAERRSWHTLLRDALAAVQPMLAGEDRFQQLSSLVNGFITSHADSGEDVPLILERVAVTALLQPVEKQDAHDKYKCYGLMKKIHGAQETVELNAEEIAFVKRAVGASHFTAIVVGQAWDLIEGTGTTGR
jgi:hypothetical protein